MFQRKIIEKYLSKLDGNLLNEKYKLFCSIFDNAEKQENIRNSKEEQYQEGFIRDLFCSVLGYTIKPEANYNILTELKNEVKNKSNNKKSDGAIIINDNVKAVIELKGTDTQDLDKVAFQAFSYKNFHANCNYVIVSNFERLRFYVEVQSDFEEFNIQKMFVRGLVRKQSRCGQITVVQKTQKLLDRILFVLFCEDRALLPANSVLGIIDDYSKLKQMGYYQPLYSCFKTFFDRIDKGFINDADHARDVFAYNGGLFKSDEVLDSIKVGDDVLFIHSKRLADYDFESQISVDILGRIFENSLTEIEEVQKQLKINELSTLNSQLSINNIGKRKKDGVFYTPAYITKYIVENTIGKLCDEKRNELNINDDTFSVRKRQNATIAELDKLLDAYREWLLGLKILDCACGSGAFLIAALHELIKQHELIDKYYSNIHKKGLQSALNFTQIENSILENNLYGVDINDDSIEIAKLSLWLNTAKKNRKLTTLNDKIKCGNSLIDDEAIAKEKAFNWKNEFKEVFENGGFDVIIGNPPYVNMNNIKNESEKQFYRVHYKTIKDKSDLYSIFTEKSKYLLKENGLFGFIFSNSWMGIQSFTEFRKFLAKM